MDTNYSNTEAANRVDIFEKYCEFLNAFDESIQFQIHILTKQLARTSLRLSIEAPKDASPTLRQCIGEYNDLQRNRFVGDDSYIQEKYITISIAEENYDAARKRIDLIDNETMDLLRRVCLGTHRLDKLERLTLLREVYRPDDTAELSYDRMVRTGIHGKDLIAPYSMDTTHDNYIMLGDYFTQTLFLTDYPLDISDELIKEITSVDESILLTINVLPQNPQAAIQSVKQRQKKLDREKEDNRSKQAKMGVLDPEPPRELRKAIESTDAFLNDLESRNEKMFLANVLIHARAKTLEDLRAIVEKIANKVNKSGCTIKPFTFAQEEALDSVVPLGRNDTFVKRTFTTTSLAAFIPFNVVEIVQHDGLSYGKNKLSHNVICLDRKQLQNPHGFYFGQSGSGKSMAAKAEIWECFWRTDDDMIIVDLDGEFTKVVKLLGGQVIEVSNAATTKINPFDINENYGGGEDPNPVPFKSDYIISLIEVTLNYRNGIDPIMRSVIDRCVRYIYSAYLDDPREENIPTFVDFYKALQKQREPEAKYLVSALEIYIEGSLNIFADKTNVDIHNRLICFNVKDLGSQLKVMGMTVIQDFIWNQISKNQALDKKTWLWNDEIHHSLKNQNTGDWLINSWKRGRKYGLIATGMTQEVRDVCRSEEAKALISNSEFIVLYKQKPDMIPDIAQVMSLSDNQVKKLLSCEEGTGLMKAGNSMVEFSNRFEQGTKLFEIFSTDVGKKKRVG